LTRPSADEPLAREVSQLLDQLGGMSSGFGRSRLLDLGLDASACASWASSTSFIRRTLADQPPSSRCLRALARSRRGDAAVRDEDFTEEPGLLRGTP